MTLAWLEPTLNQHEQVATQKLDTYSFIRTDSYKKCALFELTTIEICCDKQTMLFKVASSLACPYPRSRMLTLALAKPWRRN